MIVTYKANLKLWTVDLLAFLFPPPVVSKPKKSQALGPFKANICLVLQMPRT